MAVKTPAGVSGQLDRIAALDAELLQDFQQGQRERREHDVLATAERRLARQTWDLPLEALEGVVEEAHDIAVREASGGRVGARSVAAHDRPAGRYAPEGLATAHERQRPPAGTGIRGLVKGGTRGSRSRHANYCTDVQDKCARFAKVPPCLTAKHYLRRGSLVCKTRTTPTSGLVTSPGARPARAARSATTSAPPTTFCTRLLPRPCGDGSTH